MGVGNAAARVCVSVSANVKKLGESASLGAVDVGKPRKRAGSKRCWCQVCVCECVCVCRGARRVMQRRVVLCSPVTSGVCTARDAAASRFMLAGHVEKCSCVCLFVCVRVFVSFWSSEEAESFRELSGGGVGLRRVASVHERKRSGARWALINPQNLAFLQRALGRSSPSAQ